MALLAPLPFVHTLLRKLLILQKSFLSTYLTMEFFNAKITFHKYCYKWYHLLSGKETCLVTILATLPFVNTAEPCYPDTLFSCNSAYHVSFSKSQFFVYDFNVNELWILGH